MGSLAKESISDFGNDIKIKKSIFWIFLLGFLHFLRKRYRLNRVIYYILVYMSNLDSRSFYESKPVSYEKHIWDKVFRDNSEYQKSLAVLKGQERTLRIENQANTNKQINTLASDIRDVQPGLPLYPIHIPSEHGEAFLRNGFSDSSWDHKNFNEWLHWNEVLLDAIAKAEWTYDNYNAIYGNGSQNVLQYTNMTLREIRRIQLRHARLTGSSAIGRYQIMRDTLGWLIKKLGLSLDEKFTPELQDRLALALLEERWLSEFKSGAMSASEFQLGVSKVWASVPKDASGKSYYHWDSMNNKSTTEGRKINSEFLKTLYV